MVLSHALIAPLRGAVAGDNLRNLFDRLLDSPRQPSGLQSLDIELDGQPPPSSRDLMGAAEALTLRGNGPVVRPGTDDFESLVLALWAHLWPQIRMTFAYRLSFGPGDIFESPPPTLVCTPMSLVARWQGHRIIDHAPHKPPSNSVALLCGWSQGQAMRAFASDIGASLASFGDLPLLEQAYQPAIVGPEKFGNTTAAVRLVEKLSPDPEKGGAGKDSLLTRLALQAESANASAMLGLRNLKLDAFQQRNVVWAALEQWVAKHTYPVAQDSAFLRIIESATREAGAVASWRTAVIAGLRAASRVPNGTFAPAFWRWAEIQASILSRILGCWEVDTEFESRLIETAPRILKREAAEVIIRFATERRLPRLHAMAASQAYSAMEATRQQIAMEDGSPSVDTVALALRNATPAEVLACALEIALPCLYELAGKAVADQPTLMTTTDTTRAPAQAIWRASLHRNPGAWRAPADPRAAFDDLLTNLVDGGAADQDLVAVLATTPLANLGSFARRGEVWMAVSGITRSRLLSATAKNWIAHSKAGMVPFSPDPHLQAEILASRELSDTLDALTVTAVTNIIEIVVALPLFDEGMFLRWLQGLRDAPQAKYPWQPPKRWAGYARSGDGSASSTSWFACSDAGAKTFGQHCGSARPCSAYTQDGA